MTSAQAFLLGLLQGITEFLPVSSSGHLVLAETMFSLSIDPLSMQSFNVLLHAGTLLALLFCYRERWYHLLLAVFTKDTTHRRLLLFLVLATIPGAIAGLFLEEVIASQFSSRTSVAVAFLITAAILVVGERVEQSKRIEHLATRSTLFIGLAQAFALIPGLSRSGLTISAARVMHVDRKEALDFSFLMAVPIIAGASAMAFWDLSSGSVSLPNSSIIFVGFLSSFVASVLAIRFLRSFVVNHSLAWFSWYLVAASTVLLLQGV